MDEQAFRDLCDGHASGGFETAGYRGPAPHPLLIVPLLNDPYFAAPGTGGKATTKPALAKVQLVACASRIGRVTDTPIAECGPYRLADSGSPYYVDYYQGRYLVTVYEARTGRKVGSVHVDAQKDQECPREYTATPGDHHIEQDVEPSTRGYSAALASYVTGRAK